MKHTSKWLLLLFLFFSISVIAQKKTTKKTPPQKQVVTKQPTTPNTNTVEDEKKIHDMISFLEFMLNTLGNSSTPVRDKEVLITESYAKIFRDSKVQIEDDLDEERKVITNKDVVAYLKDINFFFQQARFEFTIGEIKSGVTSDGQQFYKVTTTRNLKATTADQKAVNNTKPRFIEINYNPKEQDLKIVSMYTNEFDEKKALTNWWKSLSLEWKSVFREKYNLTDSVSLNDLKTIKSITDLNISNHSLILNLDPLSELTNLSILNISGTQIKDITPIRNLSELVELDLSSTEINQLSPLRYAAKLEVLNLNNTAITDLSVLSKLTNLKQLTIRDVSVSDFTPLHELNALQIADLSQTQIMDLSPFESLVQLQELHLSETYVQELTPLIKLKSLEILELDNTPIRNIKPAEELQNLKILYINHTAISDLTPLLKLPQLEKVYCDQTLIKRQEATIFMTRKPATLVIFDSKDLKAWWDALTADWRLILTNAAKINKDPTKEELARIPLVDSINISGKTEIKNLEALRKLERLRILIANKTAISDLSPLRNHQDIQRIEINETNVTDLLAISELKNLKVLKAENNAIENITFLQIPSLKLLYVDQSAVDDQRALHFLIRNPDCLLIYKTEKLKNWWFNLSEVWKEIFTEALGKNKSNTTENLHHLIQQRELSFKDKPITNLSPLSEFIQLKNLHFSGTNMTSISPIKSIQSLESLHATNSPITNLDSLKLLTVLKDLDISNTPIDDIYEVWNLKELTKLNCSGTQIKRLDALEMLEKLEYLDFANTFVSKINPLDYLPLKTLKCYNTKVSSKTIERYKASHPDCNVVYYR